MKKVVGLMVLFFAGTVDARLSDSNQQNMVGCAAAVQATYQSTLDGKANDCEKLQYLLNYKVVGCQILNNATLHYILHKDYDGSGLNFDACNLGYIHGDTDNVLTYPAVIHEANFSSASMIGVKLNHAWADRVNFKSADLTSAVLNHLQIHSHGIFESSTLINATLYYARLANISFKNADLTGAELNHAKLVNCDFSGADLTDAVFKYATLKHLYCDSDNLPTVSNTTLPDGTVLPTATTDAIAVSNADTFCKAFTDAPTHS